MKQKDKWAFEYCDSMRASQKSMGNDFDDYDYSLLNTGWAAGFDFAIMKVCQMDAVTAPYLRDVRDIREIGESPVGESGKL